jgi:hypothetical protein
MNVELIELSSLMPSGWGGWFSEMLSNAPFSWGDNNRSLITASRLYRYCFDNLEDAYPEEATEEVKEADIHNFLHAIKAMGETYIDLEN